MKAITFILSVAGSSLLAAGVAWSQEIIKLDPGYYCTAEPGVTLQQVATFPPTRAARRVFEHVIEATGMSPDRLELRQMDAGGLLATVHPASRERMVFYNEAFLQRLNEDSRSGWAAHAILAHELAHHINSDFDSADPDDNREEELAADRFAGRALANMGASLDATERVFRELRAGGEYPSTLSRVTAARSGWLSTGPPIITDPPERPRVIALALAATHSQSVYHAGGNAPGPGFQFALRGRLEYSRQATVSVSVYFEFQNGEVIYPHPSESDVYRARSTPGVATGSGDIGFPGGVLDLGGILVAPMPYYTFNLIPTNLRTTYFMRARARVFVDGTPVAMSPPLPLFLVW